MILHVSLLIRLLVSALPCRRFSSVGFFGFYGFYGFYGDVGVNLRVLVVGLVGLICASALAAAPAGGIATGGSISASEQTCRACHSMDTTKVGPPFRAISERYRGDPDAVAKLKRSMLEGSSGKWNTGARMPANAISAEEAERFAKWVLGVR
ncbi:c-type cytochrome [Paraburkholderia aromaticivorans]|uniref:c-type cytochrome n=1 Tax=Paraburkholderia aromaticivorans TaxID=2026199 RepID=UPI001F101061|nr:c-type cytochrome [Paraburkholderia aromaticivorans]